MGPVQIRFVTLIVLFVGNTSSAINRPDEIQGARNSTAFLTIQKSAARITLRSRGRDGRTNEFAVSGTLVDRDTVATAGHAFSVGATEMWVDINGYRFEASLANVRVPQGYRWSKYGCPEDIALVQLSRPVPESLIQSGRIRPMALLPDSERGVPGKKIQFAGFGNLADAGYQTRDAGGRMQMKSYTVMTADLENPTIGLGQGPEADKPAVPGASGLPSGGDSGGSVVYFIGETPYLVGTLEGSSQAQQCFTWRSVRPYLIGGPNVTFRVPAKVPEISPDALSN